MIGMFMLNPPTRASPAKRQNPWVSYSNKKRSKKKMAWWDSNPKTRSRKTKSRKARGSKAASRIVRAAKRFTKRKHAGWKDSGSAHAVAAKIGWTYRKYAADFRRFGSYAARGTTRGKHKGLTITDRSLKRYRDARRTPLSRLEGRREWFKHKTTRKTTYAGAMKKAKRRFGMLYNASSYQKFIGKAMKGTRGRAEVRRRFRAAVKAWKRRKSGHRDNPVLPISYDNRRKKRRKSRKNSLYRSGSGRFARRGGHKLRKIKGGGWHNKKRSRKNPLFRSASGRYAKRGGHKLRRYSGGGWRSNSPILPYTAYSNPVAAITGTFSKLADVTMWTRTILPITAGFIGTHAVALMAVKMIAPAGTKFEGIVKHGARAVSAALLSATVGIVSKDSDMAAKVLAGGLVAVLGGVIADLIGPDYTKATGLGEMNDLADDLTEDLKAKIAAGVRKQFANADDDDGSVSAFVTAEDLSRAPRLGDFVTSEALRQATVGSDRPGRAGGGPPREQALAGLETFQDALAEGSLI